MQGNFLASVELWLLVVGVVFLAALTWIVGSSLSAIGSGWHKLEHRFRAHGQFAGQQKSFQTGMMRWGSRYNHSLKLGASQDGLYVGAMWLARMAHPPLFIPWSEVSAIDHPRRFREGTLLTLGRKEQVPLWVFKSTGDWLRGCMPSTEEKIAGFYTQDDGADRSN